jgi:ubiquitin-associated SH3 domain-containing protein
MYCNISVAAVEDTSDDLHLTLAYQFKSAMYPKLEKLVKEVDLQQLRETTWEFRLYSREARAIGHELYRVLYSHVPIENDELELLIDDFVYVRGDDLSTSLDGWVQGTSWLTGSSGFVPINYIHRTAESDAWTLHK